MGLTVEDLVRMVGDPQFSAQVSATFGGLVRAQRDHGGAGTETATDPGNGPGP